MTIGISKERLLDIVNKTNCDLDTKFSIRYLIDYECTELNPWKPIESAPDKGRFLVYMPDERLRKYQVAYYDKNIDIIGNNFAFDLSKPTLYCELPELPGDPE